MPPAGRAKVTLRQRGYGVVAGTVVDEATRAPIAGLRCQLTTEAERWGHARPDADTAVTDRKGMYRFDRVLAGTTSVSCSKEGIEAQGESEVSAGQTSH